MLAWIIHGSTQARRASEGWATTYPRLRVGLVWSTLRGFPSGSVLLSVKWGLFAAPSALSAIERLLAIVARSLAAARRTLAVAASRFQPLKELFERPQERLQPCEASCSRCKSRSDGSKRPCGDCEKQARPAWHLLHAPARRYTRGADSCAMGRNQISRAKESNMAGQYFPQGDNQLRTWMTNFLAQLDRKSTRLNSSHSRASRMPSSA